MMQSLTSPITVALAITLLHSLWQAALVAMIYRVLIATPLGRSADSRYWTGLALLSMLMIGSVATFLRTSNQRLAPLTLQSVAIVNRSDRTFQQAPQVEVTKDVSGRRSETVTSVVHPIEKDLATLPAIETLAPFIVILWSIGIVTCGGRLLIGWAWMIHLQRGRVALTPSLLRRANQLARQIGVADAVVVASHRIGQAAVVGFIRPAVLIPTSWITAMPPDVIESVLAHELAHIRRFDVWIGFLQRIIETIYFFHPAVLWLSDEIRLQREVCCDAIAARAVGRADHYAKALEYVGQWSAQTNLTLAMSITGEKKMNLLYRVRNVLGMDTRREANSSPLVGLLAVFLPAFLIATIQLSADTTVATAQDREGGISAEAQAGPRRSAEAESRDRPRERGDREDGDRERGDAEDGDRSDSRNPLDRFRPANERERVLVEMIRQLQREVTALRREVRGGRVLDGDRGRERGLVRDGDRDMRNWQRSKEGKVFLAYDKNRDMQVTLDEWLAMTNGNVSEARRALQTQRFNRAEPSGDGKFTPEEFIDWYGVGRFKDAGREGDGDRPERRLRDGDGDRPERRLRDGAGSGDRPRLRDGEGSRRGPRDGESDARRGPREGQVDREGRGDREES